MALFSLGVINFLQTNVVDLQVQDVEKSNLPLFEDVGGIQVLALEQDGVLFKSVCWTTSNVTRRVSRWE